MTSTERAVAGTGISHSQKASKPCSVTWLLTNGLGKFQNNPPPPVLCPLLPCFRPYRSVFVHRAPSSGSPSSRFLELEEKGWTSRVRRPLFYLKGVLRTRGTRRLLYCRLAVAVTVTVSVYYYYNLKILLPGLPVLVHP